MQESIPEIDIETYKIAKAYKQMQSAPEALRCGLGRIKVCESSLTRILGKRPQGFCVVSACRRDWNRRLAPDILGIPREEFEELKPFERHELAKKMSRADNNDQRYFAALDNRMHNDKKTEELVEDLRRLRLGYVPVYGGFREGGSVDLTAAFQFPLTFLSICARIFPFKGRQ